MADTPGDDKCVERWRAGDEQAAAELYNRYVQRLVAVAQRRLSAKLAARLDPEDIVQSVFRSFFGRAQEGKFTFKEADDVWKLLVQITIHKTLKQVDYHRRGKRNAAAEVSPSERHQDLLIAHLAKEPTPEEATAFLDELEHFLQQMRPEDRKVIEMRLEGYDNIEIAAKLGISDRKIRRLMERMRGLAENQEYPGLYG
jgi:RNA polymerase sigma-70 factor (ECF subfamily)